MAAGCDRDLAFDDGMEQVFVDALGKALQPDRPEPGSRQRQRSVDRAGDLILTTLAALSGPVALGSFANFGMLSVSVIALSRDLPRHRTGFSHPAAGYLRTGLSP